MSSAWLIATRSLCLAGTLAVAWAPVAPVRAADEGIGTAALADQKVRGNSPAVGERQIFVGNDVFFKERIETSRDGRAQLLFSDKSTVTLGPRSELTIDKYVYDPEQGTGETVMDLTSGAMRFVGGKISNSEGIEVNTPTSSIGIRGSIVEIRYNGRATTIDIFKSDFVRIAGPQGTAERIVTESDTRVVVSPDNTPTLSKLSPEDAADLTITFADPDGGDPQSRRLGDLLANESGERLDDGDPDEQLGNQPGGGPETQPDPAREREQARIQETDQERGQDPGADVEPEPVGVQRALSFPFAVDEENVRKGDEITDRTLIENGEVYLGGSSAFDGTVEGVEFLFIDLSDWSIEDFYAPGEQPPEEQAPEGVELCECDYVEWGVWGKEADQGVVPSSDQPSLYSNLGTWVAGELANTARLPDTGTATYTGHAIGRTPSSYRVKLGSFSQEWHFGKDTGSFELDFDDRNLTGTVTSDNGRDFQGAISGETASGEVEGSFYKGADDPAAESAGTFRIDGDEGYEARGVFAGDKE